MSGRSSPVNGGYEGPVRLAVRKDLFPEAHLANLEPGDLDELSDQDELEAISCVKLETDFEQSIDEIANQKLRMANGIVQPPTKTRHKKHKQHSKRDHERSTHNGCLPQKKKKSSHDSHHKNRKLNNMLKVKGGKNLNLVSSSERQKSDDDDDEEEEQSDESSDDEVLKFSVKLPIIVPRQSGKPYSHELSQLSSKKSKSKDSSKERRSHAVTPCSGKPRAMLGIRSSRSKKKLKKLDCEPTYRSQIVDTNTIKIKIRRTGAPEAVVATPMPTVTVTPTPTSIADLGQRKSKKKRAASPVASESSGEEYDPSKGVSSGSMSVAAPKKGQPRPKTKKPNNTKSKDKREKTERSRVSEADVKDAGPQSPWAYSVPEEILIKIFEHVVASQGTLPSVIRLGRVCKLWHSMSCRPELWKNVDLAQYTSEKCKTDYKLVWLLENRLSKCQSLNIGQWKVCNVSWVLACVADYCPSLVELSLAGWSRITPDQLYELLQGLPNLQRLDLSVTSETGGSGTCLSQASMARLLESFGGRFTHLTLANNKFTALPQILSSVAAYCQSLEVLDISGAQATSHPAAIPLEALQKGCPKLRVFRAANSQLVLASATTAQQMEVEGWTQLEELSIAGEAAAERVGVGEYRLGDEALARLVRGATRLRLLDLRGLHRLTDSGLVRVPAWDLQHLFLGGCNVTRQKNACLELICEKWSHSLIELDLSWASAARVLDDAVRALADSTNSRLKVLNLCGSSVSLEPVKKVLLKCPLIESLNLSSCRGLPRGMKRLYVGKELQDLKDSFDPVIVKAKEEAAIEKGKKNNAKKAEADSKLGTQQSPNDETSQSSISKEEFKSQNMSPVFQEPRSISESETSLPEKKSSSSEDVSYSVNKAEIASPVPESIGLTRDATSKLLSPMAQSKPDSSSTPRSDPSKLDIGSPHYSPVPKPDSQVQNSPEVQSDSVKTSNSWSLGQFRTTQSEASPLNRMEGQAKMRHGKVIEQCSPTTSVDIKPSLELVGAKQESIKNPNWNYGNYSPMTRQDTLSSQRSPYSAQPSPAQPSPYSTQPSPYSTQPSPYSSQPSPYSAQPSPDTSQMVKTDLQKSGSWNTGSYSPMPKHHAPFSPHPSTHTSPDPGSGVKTDTLRNNPNKTPGQYSPMSRQDRLLQSPYSPRPSVENVAYSNKKSPASVGNYSPMMRTDCHLPSSDGAQTVRSGSGRSQDVYSRPMSKAPEVISNISQSDPTNWGMDRYNQIASASTQSIESLVWGTSAPPYSASLTLPPRTDNIPVMLNTPPPQQWSGLPSFESSARRTNDDLSDPWTLGQFRVEPPQSMHNTFVEQNVSFESLSAHINNPAHALQKFLEEGFTESSRVD